MKLKKKLNALMPQMFLLETGIFTDFSPAVVKFPTCIVRIVEADSKGVLWFIVRKPFQNISGLATFFFGKLELFNRSFSFYIIAEGTVVMHYDKGSVPKKIAGAMNNDNVAMAFHVVEACRTNTKKKPTNMMTILTGIFSYLFAAR
jgi:hypothetical protein